MNVNYTTKDGRIFENIGAEPYTRKDGKTITLLKWQCKCAKCEQFFTVKTPMDYENNSSFCNKHCVLHKKKVRSGYHYDMKPIDVSDLL